MKLRLPPMGRWLLRLMVLCAGLWSLLSLYFLIRDHAVLRWTMVAVWLGLSGAALWGLRAGRENWALPGIFALAFTGMQIGWWTMQPQQDRDWADDVAERLSAEVHGDRVVLHNVRDFDWRSDSDYHIRWQTREYDLNHLVSADLALSYWMGPAIAHTLVSFGFDDGSQVVFSLEIRKQRGESFSALGGFFRSFEETLIAAEERDILRVRTNVRDEDMYLYRLNLPREALRSMFLGYVERARALDQQPRFYNTLTSNCTTIVFDLARRLDPGLPLDWRLLASGYLAEYAFDQHGLLPGYSFEQLKRGGHITARARAADRDPAFSARIRVGMPLQAAGEVR